MLEIFPKSIKTAYSYLWFTTGPMKSTNLQPKKHRKATFKKA
jgi:hypothetical protein